MTEIEPVEGSVVPVPPVADIRYDDGPRALVRVDYADGKVREYEARDPQDFRITDPEDISTIAFRRTGLSLGAGEGFGAVTAGVPTLSVSFTAHPRHNMDIRTERTASPWQGPEHQQDAGHHREYPELPGVDDDPEADTGPVGGP
jgi:hypothetical protein